MHAQIVLCPDWNDGGHLARTVVDLERLHPDVTTTAIVPVGLTRHRERLPELRLLTADEARRLVVTIEQWQQRCLATLGSRFVFAADEIYLQAQAPLPEADAYEGFPVAEDGIGLVRRFEDELGRALGRVGPARTLRKVTVVTGALYGPRLERWLSPLVSRGVDAHVVSVPNDFFGRTITVAGLLTGQDIQRHLAGLDRLGDEVLVPAVAVRDGNGVFLDDVTPADLARALGVTVRVVEHSARALLRALRSSAAPDVRWCSSPTRSTRAARKAPWVSSTASASASPSPSRPSTAVAWPRCSSASASSHPSRTWPSARSSARASRSSGAPTWASRRSSTPWSATSASSCTPSPVPRVTRWTRRSRGTATRTC